MCPAPGVYSVFPPLFSRLYTSRKVSFHECYNFYRPVARCYTHQHRCLTSHSSSLSASKRSLFLRLRSFREPASLPDRAVAVEKIGLALWAM